MNETALKERLKTIAREKETTFNEIWKQFLLERFLARLSQSRYQDKFIFKGGLLLAKYIEIGRETTDADFLIRNLKNQMPIIQAAIIDIIATSTNDKFQFQWDNIKELSQPHMAYPGFRASLKVQFGKMNDKIQIDIGVGDLVSPIKKHIDSFKYKNYPIFEDEISLLVYPLETIFAEKLETVISKGSGNSRMKDYHDLLLLSRDAKFIKDKKLSQAITKTFQHRKTNLQIPIQFDETGIHLLQNLWNNHLTTLGSLKDKLNLPDQINVVIDEINGFLQT